MKSRNSASRELAKRAAITSPELVQVEAVLQKIEAGRRALVSARDARDLDGAKRIRDQANGYKQLLTILRRRGEACHEAQAAAGDLHIRARRVEGEILELMQEVGERRKHGKHEVAPGDFIPTLADLGYSPQDAAKVTALAALPEETFEKHISTAIEKHEPPTIKGALKLAASVQREKQSKDFLSQSIDLPEGVYHGDFRTLAPEHLPDSSVHLVLTDPPYDKESVGLFADAAAKAARVLRPGGSFLVYSGQKYLGDVHASISQHLRYWWTLALVHQGSHQLLQKLGIRCGWKPVLWFVKETRGDVQAVVSDLIAGGGREKFAHEWQQGEAEAVDLIQRFTNEGDVVVDFFAGSGTVLSAAKSVNRRFVGFEANAGHVESIVKRLA
jgi:16S rRNA G966 N2-methylase RsmD